MRSLQGEVCVTVVVESRSRRESVDIVTGVALAAVRAGGELIAVRALVTLCTHRLSRELERCECGARGGQAGTHPHPVLEISMTRGTGDCPVGTLERQREAVVGIDGDGRGAKALLIVTREASFRLGSLTTLRKSSLMRIQVTVGAIRFWGPEQEPAFAQCNRGTQHSESRSLRTMASRARHSAVSPRESHPQVRMVSEVIPAGLPADRDVAGTALALVGAGHQLAAVLVGVAVEALGG